MKTLFNMTTVILFAATAFAADPIVSGEPTVSQGTDRKVMISYTLADAPAIVAFEVFTNGVSIGGRPLWASWGDVNVVVQPGNRTIFWQPREWSDRFVVDGSVSVKVTAHALDNPPDYMAVDLSIPSNRVWYANAEAVPLGVTNNLYKTTKLLMRRIHAAGIRWRKGSSQGQATGHWASEIAYPVILTKDYYIGVFPVTYRQHKLFSAPGSTDILYQYYPQQSVSAADLRGALPAYDWQANGSAVDHSLPIGKLRDTIGRRTDLRSIIRCPSGNSGILLALKRLTFHLTHSGNSHAWEARRIRGSEWRLRICPNTPGIQAQITRSTEQQEVKPFSTLDCFCPIPTGFTICLGLDSSCATIGMWKAIHTQKRACFRLIRKGLQTTEATSMFFMRPHGCTVPNTSARVPVRLGRPTRIPAVARMASTVSSVELQCGKQRKET